YLLRVLSVAHQVAHRAERCNRVQAGAGGLRHGGSPGASDTMKIGHTDKNVNSGEISEAIARPAKRLRRTPEEAQRLILETAQALIARTGPEGLRLQDIAAEAGISHSLILHHFGSREGLVRALIRQAAAELRDKLIAAMESTEYSVEEQLDRVFDAFRDG